ncbi:dTDP-4-dehydrorhamnose 3,5-epimerase family protein [Gammaproteobacteria bacterium]|jgi:dTDP-4-dehydrorhamnose 3,5-epimerase|nr:dTDP-4-dehydrorhamnose 3,5-epimerase family protein [Gammaproteobacteria bacterium]|tara:strand:+ start:175 stop:669 length:495 start_codon:yes stop_codon:yes gene_type:complete
MVYKNIFKGFPDNRGFLNPIDLDSLLRTIEKPDFIFQYQLISSSKEKNVFRGFHYQKAPEEQIKILIVHQGTIKDIIFPIDSQEWSCVQEFDLEAGDVIVVPNNFAHGFYTKSSDVLLQYLMDKKFSPDHYTGFNPLGYIQTRSFDSEPIISNQDMSLPKPLFE